MNKRIKKPRNQEMYEAILKMETVEECMKFFDDLCTVSELLPEGETYLDNAGRLYAREES